ncbi:MAG TPA: DUF4079 domain-containing protein [Microcoleaceae cyanobacterium]|jgi:hypothetical protein
MTDLPDLLRLLHSILAVVLVYPIIGIVVKMAWQTRQRRLEIATNGKSKIPPIVGQEHVQIGHWLSGAVVGIALLGMAQPIFKQMINTQMWNQEPLKAGFIVLMFLATIAALVFLYRATQRFWRGVFATLTGVGLIVLGFQTDGMGHPLVFRRDNEWFLSHYYFGIAAAFLMIFSLAIIQDIYHDRQNRWRTAHIILNCLALLLFISQGITGTRDLLEIPLHWQEPYVYSCDSQTKTCPPLAPPATALPKGS